SKRRVFNYKVKLPSNLVRILKLNDRVVIKGRRYILNTMDINLTTGEGNLELINDIYRGETQESLTTKILLSSYYGEFIFEAGQGEFTYQTNEDVNPVVSIEVIDIGSGTGWVSFTHTGNKITYDVLENITGA